jgi:hypothetical protein
MTLRHGISSSCRSPRDSLSVRLISLIWRSGRMQRAVACLNRYPQMAVSLPTGPRWSHDRQGYADLALLRDQSKGIVLAALPCLEAPCPRFLETTLVLAQESRGVDLQSSGHPHGERDGTPLDGLW